MFADSSFSSHVLSCESERMVLENRGYLENGAIGSFVHVLRTLETAKAAKK